MSETPVAFRRGVLSRCVVKRYGRGDAVYSASDEAGGLFGLVEGGIGVEVMPDDRPPYLGFFVQPGFWIGEVSVLTRRPRAVGLNATRDCILAHLPLAQWDSITRADPEAWRWLAHLILRNELMLVAIADALMIRHAAARVAAMLLVMVSSGAAPDSLPDPAFEVNQEDLARITNLSRSSLGRILADFAAEGLIRFGYRQIRIADAAGLRRRRSET